ncbi:MAG: EF-hand domain-containing protein [Methylophilaceae bacterium]|nr:EF-hand domain-containing protein [Methylophilaceae bacterium]
MSGKSLAIGVLVGLVLQPTVAICGETKSVVSDAGHTYPAPFSLEQRLTPEEQRGIYRHLQTQAELNYGDHAQIEHRRQALRKRMQERLEQADSSLSRIEAETNFPGLARHFDEIDLNHDGQITLEEFKAAQEIRRQVHERLMASEVKPVKEPVKEIATNKPDTKRHKKKHKSPSSTKQPSSPNSV